jgi:hypothetical protein
MDAKRVSHCATQICAVGIRSASIRAEAPHRVDHILSEPCNLIIWRDGMRRSGTGQLETIFVSPGLPRYYGLLMDAIELDSLVFTDCCICCEPNF